MSRRGSSRATALLLALVAVAGAACGGGESEAGSGQGRSERRRSARPPSTDNPGCEFIVAGTESRFTTPGDTVEYLVDAQATSTTCYDQITFTFDQGDAPDGVPPGYRVEYREEPFGLIRPDGEPLNTSTAGCCAGPEPDVEAVLFVALTPASTTDIRVPGVSRDTYLGNLRLRLEGMEHVLIVEWIQPTSLPPDPTPADQSDNAVFWLIGLDEERPFTVDFASEPEPHVNVLIMK